MTWLRARRLAVMADPARVQLLDLILSRWEVTALTLAGPQMDVAEAQAHLDAMAGVGLLEPRRLHDGVRSYAPTADALAMFGGQVLDRREDRTVRPAPRLTGLVEALARDFQGVFARETIEQFVVDSHALLATRASVRAHLPVLTARFAADRLAALARAEGRTRRTSTDVLFVCVRNAGRSQIAATILRSRAGPHVRVRTAGSLPGARINPHVATLLERRGHATVNEFPKPLTDEVVRASDYVITMGCGDACPLHPGPTYLDWQVLDPSGQQESVIEAIIDEVTHRVEGLMRTLSGPAAPAGTRGKA
ncbi:low molecular weight phosphatase family protein [Pseudactinotalea sp. Z1748]|uniref:arsenate-mycothiol transferase ArsC n=1 Tax=Pseudactinotalea sp. Z1748 TaxID=3413027 RepID=UPI003C7A4932